MGYPVSSLWFPASLLLDQLVRWWGRSVCCSDRKVPSAALLTLHRLTVCCLWRGGNGEQQDRERNLRVEMRLGAAACSPEELMWNKDVCMSKPCQIKLQVTYSGTRNVLRLLLTGQSEGTKSARTVSVKTLWMLAQQMCFVPVCLGVMQHPFLLASGWF